MQQSGRDRLLAAALKLFADKGYGATSVADIQRASGLAPGSGALYKHFASKRDLLEAAVAIGSLSYAATLQALTGRSPGNIDDDRYFEAWVMQTLSVLDQYAIPRNP